MRWATKACVTLCAGTFILLGCGCSSAPLESDAALQVLAKESLLRVVSLEVECEDESLFGSTEEWMGDFIRVFEELDVCTDLRTRSGAPTQENADLLVKVSIQRAPRKPQGVAKSEGEPEGAGGDAKQGDPRDKGELETHVETQGAVLDVVAWSTVPLLPLWIDDVTVDPGLLVRVDRSLPETAGEIQWSADAKPIQVAPTQTCYLDRHDFLSWETLGAIFVPPFVFSGPDEEQLVESIGPRLREEVAVQVAGIIKGSSLSFELLQNLRVERDADEGLLLAYQASSELARLEVSVDPDRDPRISKNVVGTERGGTERLPLRELEKKGSLAGRFLRIDALGNRGSLVRYSVTVPEEPPPAQ